MFGARPVALVFEVDRLTIVSANEVQLAQLSAAPEGLRALPWAGVHLAGMRQHTSPSELLESIDMSLQGVTPAMRPAWWVPYDAAKPEVIGKAKPLTDLLKARPKQSDLLESAAATSGLPIEALGSPSAQNRFAAYR